jgi:N6-adenosine-specific RNA methylase IME4
MTYIAKRVSVIVAGTGQIRDIATCPGTTARPSIVCSGARGKPVFLHGSDSTVLEAARREHSRKPDEFYALVERVCPGSRVELFARQVRQGWQAFGNEIEKFTSDKSGKFAVHT